MLFGSKNRKENVSLLIEQEEVKNEYSVMSSVMRIRCSSMVYGLHISRQKSTYFVCEECSCALISCESELFIYNSIGLLRQLYRCARFFLTHKIFFV